MTAISADHLAAASDKFYEAAYDDRAWTAAMHDLKVMVGGASAAYGLVDLASGSDHSFYGDCDGHYRDLCFAPEICNPFVSALTAAGDGQLIADAALMPRAAFEHSTFYNEWLAPQKFSGLSAMVTMRHGDVIACLGLSHDRAVTMEAAGAIEALAPALARATRMRVRFGALRLTEKTAAYERVNVGIAVVDGAGRVLHVNALADAIFAEEGSGLTARNGVIAAGPRREAGLLKDLLASAASDTDGMMGPGGDFVVADPDGIGRPIAVTVAPMRDAGLYGLPVGRAAMVFLQRLDPPLPPEFGARIARLFGLTQKEAALATQLAMGRTLQQAAAAHGVSIHTARSQLAQIFQKTGTVQQSQLVALMLRLQPIDP